MSPNIFGGCPIIFGHIFPENIRRRNLAFIQNMTEYFRRAPEDLRSKLRRIYSRAIWPNIFGGSPKIFGHFRNPRISSTRFAMCVPKFNLPACLYSRHLFDAVDKLVYGTLLLFCKHFIFKLNSILNPILLCGLFLEHFTYLAYSDMVSLSLSLSLPRYCRDACPFRAS